MDVLETISEYRLPIIAIVVALLVIGGLSYSYAQSVPSGSGMTVMGRISYWTTDGKQQVYTAPESLFLRFNVLDLSGYKLVMVDAGGATVDMNKPLQIDLVCKYTVLVNGNPAPSTVTVNWLGRMDSVELIGAIPQKGISKSLYKLAPADFGGTAVNGKTDTFPLSSWTASTLWAGLTSGVTIATGETVDFTITVNTAAFTYYWTDPATGAKLGTNTTPAATIAKVNWRYTQEKQTITLSVQLLHTFAPFK